LLGPDPSVRWLADRITERAAGNPFFVEEIVRDFAERGVVQGRRGAYIALDQAAEVSVPATLQATIAARIDRLGSDAKRTLSAAAVVGSHFHPDLLARLEVKPTFDELIKADLVDQAQFGSAAEYAFRHPLIRAVAYESQLKSDRADLHRRLAAAIEQRTDSDENAAQIAHHLEAAEELHPAFSWHMRAGGWLTNRDIAAARASWKRVLRVADRLSVDDPDRTRMQIAPRMLLCASAFRAGRVADTGFDQLRELCHAAGDQVSLATGMAGLPVTLTLLNRHREASELASQHAELIESIGDPLMTVALLHGAMTAKFHAGEFSEAQMLAQRVIDLADGDVHRGELLIGSPLALATMIRGLARCGLGQPGWKNDFQQARELASTSDPVPRVIVAAYPYGMMVPNGALLADDTASQITAEALSVAEQSGDDFTLSMARFTHGVTLLHRAGSHHAAGEELLVLARDATEQNGNVFGSMPADIGLAAVKARTGDIDAAIEAARAIVHSRSDGGEMVMGGPATEVLVESLLQRGTAADVREAEAAIDGLAAVPTDKGAVLLELPILRLRALLARALGNQSGYEHMVNRYRTRARELGFEGHMAIAATM
jgi:hypothetical protein